MRAQGWLKLFVAVVSVLYVAAVGAGWAFTAVHADYGLRDWAPVKDGESITELATDGAASQGGLRNGDVILELDGMPAATDSNLFWSMVFKNQRRAGEHVSLVVRRPGTDAPFEVGLELGSGLADPASVHRALSYSLVGLLLMACVSAVALARPAEAAARVLLIAGVCAAFALASAVIGNLIENVWIARVHYVMAALTIASALHLSLVFPSTHPLFGWNWLARSVAARGSLVLALNYAIPLLLSIALPLPVTERWFYLVLAGWLVGACGLMFASYRYQSTRMARAQLKWVFWALSVCAGAWVLGSVVPVVTEWAFAPLPEWAAVGMFALFPGAIAVAILRYRLFEIDVLINRTLVYGSVTAMLAGLFAALSILTQRLILALTGQESQAAVVLAALVVTALFQPLRGRVQIVVDRRFYRHKYDATRTLERFALRLREEVELDRLVDGLMAVVQETMQPTHVSLWLRPSATKDIGVGKAQLAAGD